MIGIRKISMISGAVLAMLCASPTLAQDSLSAPAAGQSVLADKIRKDGVLKVGVIVSPPFIIQDPIANTYTGPIAVFLDTAAQGLGVKVEWVAVNWDTMMAGLQAKQYEVLGTAVYASEPRRKVANFVNFSRSGICYVALKANEKVKSAGDIKENALSAVIPSGASFTQEISTLYPKLAVTTKPYPPGSNDFFDDVRAGRNDLTIIEGLLAPTVAANNPDLKVVPDVDDCLAAPDFPIEIGIAVNKGDAVFEAYLGDVVKAAKPAIDAAVKSAAGQ